MNVLRWLEVAFGSLLIVVVLRDLFDSVVVPRPARGRFRPSIAFTRDGWRAWRWLGERVYSGAGRETMLGAFAPLSLIVLLAGWVIGLLVGYGLVLHGFREELKPIPENLGSSFYFSGVALLTIGFGDIVAVGPLARIIVLIEAATGLGVVATVISLLFSLYASFQRREVGIITLDAVAGAPPSGVLLLENSLHYGMVPHLDQLFAEWKVWSAEVLESHLAYPILNFFRSSHDNESWVSALGAVLDAAVLVLTTIDGVPKGPARVMYSVGTHLVEDLSHFFGFSHEHEVGIERFEFDEACTRLERAGFRLQDPEAAWAAFIKLRSTYAISLNEMGRYWSIPPALWIGDRSNLPHRSAGSAHLS